MLIHRVLNLKFCGIGSKDMDTKLMDSLSLVNLSEMSFLNFYFSLVDTLSFILILYYFATKLNFICMNQFLKCS